jgi:DNA-binding transcriptional regulator YdaS (Cro superfamily)
MAEEIDPEKLFVTPEFLEACRVRGHWQQKGLADVLGVSPRTMSRWMNGAPAMLFAHHYHSLARALAPHDVAFAGEIAARGGATLESLGLVPPPAPRPAAPAPAPAAPAPTLAAPAPTPAAPVPAPRAAPAAPALARVATPPQADAVLCAAAERLDVSPRQLRPALAAAFARAAELGLAPDALARALAAQNPK